MIGIYGWPVNPHRATRHLCLLGYTFIAQMSVTMTAIAESPDTQSSTENAASIVTLGLDGTAWDKLLIWALAAAALVAGAVVVATAGSIITHKREAEAAERNLERYKETVAGKVADARAEGVRAGETASNALERAGKLEKEAAEARREQERLKVRSLELELQVKKMGPRELTKDQISKIISSVGNDAFKPMLKVNFFEDAETVPYAEALANAFLAGGLKVSEGGRIMAGGSFGLSVTDRSGAIQRALRAAGLDYSELALDQSSAVAVLVVGRKPPQ